MSTACSKTIANIILWKEIVNMKPKVIEFHLIYSVTECETGNLLSASTWTWRMMGRLKGNLDLLGKLVKMSPRLLFLSKNNRWLVLSKLQWLKVMGKCNKQFICAFCLVTEIHFTCDYVVWAWMSRDFATLRHSKPRPSHIITREIYFCHQTKCANKLYALLIWVTNIFCWFKKVFLWNL